MSIPEKSCEKCGARVAWVGIWTNLVLASLKMIVGVTSGSKALMADGLHSTSNIITASAILVSQKFGRKEANEEFPYGYGKVEFLAAGAITILITTGAIILIALSIRHLLHEPQSSPRYTAVMMALISIGTNEMLFRYMRCVGTHANSQTIMASAWANRADCFSSLAVIIGVLGSKMGLNHMDPVAALFVVAVIIKVSVGILKNSVKALMDSSANNIYGEEIEAIVEEMEEVKGVSGLKTRLVGHKVWAELDILVDSNCSVQDGQSIALRVKEALLTKIRDLERVLINFSPIGEDGY